MKPRWFTGFALSFWFLLIAPVLPGQSPLVSDFFPVLPLIRLAQGGGTIWRPDWPPAIPPDAFSLNAGLARSITLQAGSARYTLRYNKEGFTEFPFFFQGELFQVTAVFDSPGKLAGFRVFSVEKEEASPPRVIFEVASSDDRGPGWIRMISSGEASWGAVYYGGSRDTELWYDPAGNGAMMWSYERDAAGLVRLRESWPAGEIEDYAYNSWGLLSAIDAPAGIYSVLYTAAALPRYWRIPEGTGRSSEEGSRRLTLQWDEAGRLVRAGAEGVGEYCYEYALDEAGNWIERRETFLAPSAGYLIPQGSERTVRRYIEYVSGESP